MNNGPLLSGIQSIESTSLNKVCTINGEDKWLRSDGEGPGMLAYRYDLCSVGTGSLESCPVGGE